MLSPHRFFRVLLCVGLIAVTLGAAPSAAQPTTQEMLLEYALDYAADPSLLTVTFGIEVDGEWWTVSTHVATPKAYGVADLAPYKPGAPTFYFTLDRSTLERLYRGELNALTAMGKARSSDVTPMDMDVMDGFQPDGEFMRTALSVAFHFWTRDLPERIPFGGEYTRTVHGAQASVFYYQPGFRSAFYQILPGQHANEDPEDQVNPFPSLFVVIDAGTAQGRIGGEDIDLHGREAIFIPAGVPHEFWNHGDIPAEGILLMFGEGA
jgi:mannose-6-phosphate isomerase-like protein (cupin superfamily)